ncbi:MAG: hypothetical protein AAFR38_00205 [Planctomycetota bacterium]
MASTDANHDPRPRFRDTPVRTGRPTDRAIGPWLAGGLRRVIASIEAGWLFLLAGIVLVAAVVLIPAAADLEAVRRERDLAMLVERHHEQRLDRHRALLDAIADDDSSVRRMIRRERLGGLDDRLGAALLPPAAEGRGARSLLASLEPPPLPYAETVRDPSLLERLSISDRGRVWLIGAGGLCLLLGLLPGRP